MQKIYVAHATSHAAFLNIKSAYAASKGFGLAMGVTCDFSFKRLCCGQVSCLKRNYKNMRSIGNMSLKTIPIAYEIPSKNVYLKSFRAKQLCLGKFFRIFYSNPRAFR